MVLLLSSCYADKSTVATFDYPDIEIVPSVDEDMITCAYGDMLELSVEAYQKDVTDDGLEYLWEIDLKPDSNKERVFLSDTRSFSMRVVNTPSAEPYIITCTVSNKETGFYRVLAWKLYVVSSLGEGILVANTRDNGATYDVDLLATSSVTYGYVDSKPRITTALYELGNGHKLESPITCLLSRACSNMDVANVSSFNEETIQIGTTDGIYCLDPLTCVETRRNEAMFSSSSITGISADAIFNGGGYSSFLIMNHRIYACCDMLSRTYGPIPSPETLKEGFYTTNTCASLDDQGTLFAYDNTAHDFCSIQCWQAHQGSLGIMNDTAPEKSFLADKQSVACGILKDGRGCFILKGSAGDFWEVVLDEFNRKAPQIFQLDAPDIDKAECFEFCDNTDVFYYTVGADVYVTANAGSSAVTKKLNWAADSSDESVVAIKQYRQAWFGIHQFSSSNYLFKLPDHRTQMIIATYNEKTGEGKIYLRPFNVSTGMFSAFKNNGTYGGFGRITALSTSLR